MVSLQEELDWLVYEAFGLLSDEDLSLLKRARGEALPNFPQQINLRPETVHRHGLVPGHRPFEIALARDALAGGTKTEWFARNKYRSPSEITSTYAPAYQRLLETRLQILDRNPMIRLLEQPEHKHRWTVRDYASETKAAARVFLLEALETALSQGSEIQRAGDVITEAVRNHKTREVAELLANGADVTGLMRDLMAEDAVPFLAAYRYTDTGLEKRAAWERTWALQRREDAGENVGEIPVPPKYDSKDYRDPISWRLRGKLDVPKERFISYPGCESDEDPSPVYGWAGWNHLQQAQALAALYQRRKTEEGWSAERLLPMLAGLDELAPWVKQWHNEPSAEFGGLRLGDYFADFVAAECREFDLSIEQVRAWRPVKKGRGAPKAPMLNPTTSTQTELALDAGDGDAPPKPARGRPRSASSKRSAKTDAAPDAGDAPANDRSAAARKAWSTRRAKAAADIPPEGSS
jgi:hypothetical protein